MAGDASLYHMTTYLLSPAFVFYLLGSFPHYSQAPDPIRLCASTMPGKNHWGFPKDLLPCLSASLGYGVLEDRDHDAFNHLVPSAY